jgi:hypothetical protein
VRPAQQFDDGAVLDLGICCSPWLGTGRLMRVLDVGQACRLVQRE